MSNSKLQQSISLQSNFAKQLKNNLLAVISLIVAITALSYNSWRNEVSEDNRNQRAAGFEILREAAHLQLLVDQATYGDEETKSDPIQGWVRVNLILSLSKLTDKETIQSASSLKISWQENWEDIYTNEKANVRVSNSIESLNRTVSEHLSTLR